MCLLYLGHHWEGFYKRSSWPLAWSNQSFLAPAPPFVARETLRAWQEKNHPWLELSDVHRETTENIRVTVIPFYMGMRVGAEPWCLASFPLRIPDSNLDHLGPVVFFGLEGYLGVRFWGCVEEVLKEEGKRPKDFSHHQMSFLGGIGRIGYENPSLFVTI